MKINKKIHSIALASIAIVLFLILFSSMAASASQRQIVSKTYAYVPNYDGNDVTVLDADTFQKVATIPVGAGPVGVAIASNGKTVYVTNSGSNTVSVIDPTTNRVIKSIKVESSPRGVTFSPDGERAYVANGGSGNVSVINVATNKVIKSVNVGYYNGKYSRNPYGIAATPDGKRVIVTENLIDSSLVAVIDTTTYKVTYFSAGYHAPTGIVINPQGTLAYITTKEDVAVIDLAKTAKIGSINIKYWASYVALNPTGEKLFVNCGSVYVVGTVTNNIIKTLSISTPSGMSCTPDGKWLFVAQYGSNSVTAISTGADDISHYIPIGKSPMPLGQFIGKVWVYA